MIEIRRILCPIDFSEYSRHALDHAVAIARRYESTITVLHVFSTIPVAGYAPGIPAFASLILTPADRAELIANMERFIAAECGPGTSVQPMVREAEPVTGILAEAIDMNADLLVMGTHGRSGFDRLLLGSVTEKVIRKAQCPVLTVPQRHPDAVPTAPVLFKRILCSVDFSDDSMHALNYAMSLAQEADAHLTVLYVTPLDIEFTPEVPGAVNMEDRQYLADYRRRSVDEVRERLKAAVPESVAAYCQVETMVSTGKPSREILRIAAEQQADLIVVGVQGRSGADLWFFGSTTNRIVRDATCPVLTIRHPSQTAKP